MKKNSSVSGTIFDIQRFAVNDGPGIRTTVFLKGCPLSCLWCHNPESQSFSPQLSFKAEKCKNCFQCVEVCPSGAHIIVEGQHAVNFKQCTLNGSCINACPSEALKVIGNISTVEEVMDVVAKDRLYYENSNGGVTISGGEPMSQFEFTLALLKEAKLAGIHTCVDTSGHAPQSHFKKILNYTDLFLYDYKATDPEIHEQLTGVSNELILGNLEFLYNHGANIIIRNPVVPGLNDTFDHQAAVKSLKKKYPGIKAVEEIAYHNTGVYKYKELGIKRRY